VRYLEQGNISLVMEALKERGTLRRNAPHLVRDLAFVVPNYAWWEAPFYGIGLKVYNLLAGKYGFGASKILSREETLERLPTIKTEGLRGGVVYYDGQFDDARLLINLVQTAAREGATLVNYAPVTAVLRDGEGGDDGFVSGVSFRDAETGAEHRASARVVINATGAFADSVRRMAEPELEALIAPSQGVHLVFDRSFLPGESAIMVPHTSDGRVMFAIPWHGHTLVGTTDTAIGAPPPLEPVAQEQEIGFILSTAALYLARPPRREDILSVFAGVRPLVKAAGAKSTAAISRDHTVHIDESGLMTVAGGKWTTYRKMAEDCVDQAATLGRLEERECGTRGLAVHGAVGTEVAGAEGDGGRDARPTSAEDRLSVYGADAEGVLALERAEPALAEPLDAGGALPYTGAQVVWAARHEMARTVDDCLARRTRALFLNARAAVAMAPEVARVLARELGRDEAWARAQASVFEGIARGYIVG
jgi:glycerol-3-phosphate dehydrogenase